MSESGVQLGRREVETSGRAAVARTRVLRDPVVGNRCHVWIVERIEGELMPWT